VFLCVDERWWCVSVCRCVFVDAARPSRNPTCDMKAASRRSSRMAPLVSLTTARRSFFFSARARSKS
jgi:hypothetical protein